jgi:Pyridoxamine 5'-phosphate oxidase
MTSWKQFADAEPDLAASVRARFEIRKHKTMATVRADGAPRISGIEVEFDAGELTFGMMPNSVKLADVRRDPRVAVHSPTDDPPQGAPQGWAGEAKVAGTAVEIDPTGLPAGAGRFRIDIAEVAFTHLNDAGDRLVIESWTPGRGSRLLERE